MSELRQLTAVNPPGATWAASSAITGGLAGRYISTPMSSTMS